MIVERLIITVGEALSQAHRSLENLDELIPELSDIVGARNQIVHGYRRIDPEILWEIVVDKGPKLRETLQELLEEYG